MNVGSASGLARLNSTTSGVSGARVLARSDGIPPGMRILPMVLVVVAGCGSGPESEFEATGAVEHVEAPVTHVAAGRLVDRDVWRPAGTDQPLVLRLDTRSGDSALGLTLAPLAQVHLAEADLHLHSWDCGARGRWVDVRSAKGLEFCARGEEASTCAWSSRFEVGGNLGEFVGKTVWVRRGQATLGLLRLTRTTTLAPEWYLDSPIAPFEIELEYVSTAQ